MCIRDSFLHCRRLDAAAHVPPLVATFVKLEYEGLADDEKFLLQAASVLPRSFAFRELVVAGRDGVAADAEEGGGGQRQRRADLEGLALPEVLGDLAYNKLVQDILFQANYYRDPAKTSDASYLKNSRLARWNNEGEVNATYVANWAKTDNFIWVEGTLDTVVWPRQGEQWGAMDPKDPWKTVLPMNETDWYTKGSKWFPRKQSSRAGGASSGRASQSRKRVVPWWWNAPQRRLLGSASCAVFRRNSGTALRNARFRSVSGETDGAGVVGFVVGAKGTRLTMVRWCGAWWRRAARRRRGPSASGSSQWFAAVGRQRSGAPPAAPFATHRRSPSFDDGICRSSSAGGSTLAGFVDSARATSSSSAGTTSAARVCASRTPLRRASMMRRRVPTLGQKSMSSRKTWLVVAMDHATFRSRFTG